MLSLLKAANAADASLPGVLPIDLGLGVFVLMVGRAEHPRAPGMIGAASTARACDSVAGSKKAVPRVRGAASLGQRHRLPSGQVQSRRFH
jgi:hypothetical protein